MQPVALLAFAEAPGLADTLFKSHHRAFYRWSFMFHWSRFDERAAAHHAQWPLWEKLAALSGVAVAAIALIVLSCIDGQLTLGSKTIGVAWTLTYAEQPTQLIAAIAVLEVVLLFIFYVLVRAFFVVRAKAPDGHS